LTRSTNGKRLLVCIYTHNSWGGIEVWLDNVAAYLCENGWEVIIGLARGRYHNDPERVRGRYSRYQTIEIDGRTGTPEGRTLAIQRVIGQIHPDVVMPLGMADVYRALARSKQEDIQARLLISMHAISCELFSDVLRMEPVIDLCVGVNPLQQRFLAHYGDFEPHRLITIVHGVPVPEVRRDIVTSRGQSLRILSVGRLSHQHKRVLDLVTLVDELQRRGTDFRLTIAGSGEDETELQQRLHANVLTGEVVFAGYVSPEELHRRLYPEHDALIVLSPSLGEAGPMVIQEAMVHGVVPVSSEYLGVHALGFVRHEQTGYIYPCGDISRAAECLTALANEPALLARMSRACQSEAGEFALDGVHQRWLKALNVLSQQPVRPLVNGLGVTGLEHQAGRSRLERVLSPKEADRVRQLLRRWPVHADGWAEWPGTITHADEETRIAMIADLARLDALASKEREPVHAEV
jgi:glycosyltransferase involved in cell wall biosynthesis